MISIQVENFNTISQSFYNSVVFSLQFHQLTCSCGHSGCLSVHGYYYRNVQTPDGKVRLRICRLKCSECGKTHAILLVSVVPYSQIPLEDQRQIAIAAMEGSRPRNISKKLPHIDENCVKAIIRRFRKYWKERLLSEAIPLNPAITLVKSCLALYFRQFMQIRSTWCSFFLITT